MIDTAIILAGGLGTRLRSVVPDLPKPMAPMNGRPFLSYLMDYWIDQGVRRIVLSIGYKSHAIQDCYGDAYRDAEVMYSVEETPLGTGGGLIQSLRLVQDVEDVLILNGDTFFAVDLKGLSLNHQKTGADITMALLDVVDNNRYGGVSMNQEGRIESLACSDGGSVNKRVNGGVYLMKKDVFDDYTGDDSTPRCSLEDDLFPAVLNSAKKVYGYLSDGRFIDIGVPEDYRRAPSILAAVQP